MILNHQVAWLARARRTPFGKRGVGRLSASAVWAVSESGRPPKRASDRRRNHTPAALSERPVVARQPPVAHRPCEAGSVCGCIHHRVAFFGGVLNAVVAANAAAAAPAGSTFVSFFSMLTTLSYNLPFPLHSSRSWHQPKMANAQWGAGELQGALLPKVPKGNYVRNTPQPASCECLREAQMAYSRTMLQSQSGPVRMNEQCKWARLPAGCN